MALACNLRPRQDSGSATNRLLPAGRCESEVEASPASSDRLRRPAKLTSRPSPLPFHPAMATARDRCSGRKAQRRCSRGNARTYGRSEHAQGFVPRTVSQPTDTPCPAGRKKPPLPQSAADSMAPVDVLGGAQILRLEHLRKRIGSRRYADEVNMVCHAAICQSLESVLARILQ